MTNRIPAEVFPPGEFLRDELEARGWSQAEFATILGRSAPVISQIITGKRAISPELAKEIAAALDTSAELWLNLETTYRLHTAAPAPTEIRQRARLRSLLPVREIVARGWVEDSSSEEVLEHRMLAFLRKPSFDAPSILKFAAMQTDVGSRVTAAQEAWLMRVIQLAEHLVVAPYRQDKLDDAVGKLERLLLHPDDVRHVPRILADAGVRFVVVEQLPGLKIDGVCLWLDDSRPVIGMSLRHDRIDNFWFVLRHEIEHVLNGEGREEPILDSEIEEGGDDLSAQEQRANMEAAGFCVPQYELEDFIRRKAPLITDQQIRQFAHRIERHPGLVAGQLRRRLNQWNRFLAHLAKVRHVVAGTTLADGFGQRPEVTG